MSEQTEKRGPGRPRDIELSRTRRREILQAATRRFAEHGYSHTDVQMIADDLNIGKGTVYRCFPTKEELFLSAVDEGVRGLTEYTNNEAAKGVSDLERIERGIQAYLEYFDTHPDLIELVILERAHFRDRAKSTYFVHHDLNIVPWKQLIHRLVDAGVMRDVAVERITDVSSDLLYGTIFTNHFAGRRKSLSSQCEDVMDILFRGLLTDRQSP